MSAEVASKTIALRRILQGYGNVVVAYSGGVDSALLAAVSHEVLGDEALAVTAVSASIARRDLSAARDLARNRGWNHLEVRTQELSRPEYARNFEDRCYWCKTELFDALEPIAAERGAVVALGTNVDDLGDHRPGLRAAAERGARSPMAEVGLTKQEVRVISREMGLPTADRPASPCLSSRIAYGIGVTAPRLRRIEAAEDFVRSLGFSTCRVRDRGDHASVEVAGEDLERARGCFDEIEPALRELGWGVVELDPRGYRSGSLNDAIQSRA